MPPAQQSESSLYRWQLPFAIASGVKPEPGLYTAIVADFIVSLLGGTPAQIGGPTCAFVVIGVWPKITHRVPVPLF